MADEKNTSVETKKLPPLDQVPEATPMPTLKRKTVRLDEDKAVTMIEKPALAAHLDVGEGDAEICAWNPVEVFNNLELCSRGVKEFDRQAKLLNKRSEEIRQSLKRINQISFLLNKHQMRLTSMNPTNPNDAVKQFQQRTQERKLKAVGNAQEFLKGGTNLAQMAKALSPDSPLDNAHKRQGGFGTKRPQTLPLHKPQNT